MRLFFFRRNPDLHFIFCGLAGAGAEGVPHPKKVTAKAAVGHKTKNKEADVSKFYFEEQRSFQSEEDPTVAVDRIHRKNSDARQANGA